MEWEWGSDGYPTEETLAAIEKWDEYADFLGFFSKLKPIWKYSDEKGWCGWTEKDEVDEHYGKVRNFYLSTGGWSGNESLIGAMMDNFVLWSQVFVQHRRGGHYILQVRWAKPGTGQE